MKNNSGINIENIGRNVNLTSGRDIVGRDKAMGDEINIHAGGDVAFAKDQAIATINKAISDAKVPENLEDMLKKLSAAVGNMLKEVPEVKAKEMAGDLKTFVDEATKEQPRRKWYELSGEGLIEAAKAVGSIGTPVIDLTKSVIKMLAG